MLHAPLQDQQANSPYSDTELQEPTKTGEKMSSFFAKKIKFSFS